MYVDDENLAYVMDRYRTSHDYWHVITGLPPTVEGELALKWIEYINMGLPVAGLSGLAGEFGVFAENRYMNWVEDVRDGVRVGGKGEGGTENRSFLTVYWEEEFETDLIDLRERVGLTNAAPTFDR